MMFAKSIDTILKQVEKVLNCVGSVINQCPGKKEMESLRQSPLFKNTINKIVKNRSQKKNDPNHSRDHKAKGSVNVNTRTYNKPRE